MMVIPVAFGPIPPRESPGRTRADSMVAAANPFRNPSDSASIGGGDFFAAACDEFAISPKSGAAAPATTLRQRKDRRETGGFPAGVLCLGGWGIGENSKVFCQRTELLILAKSI